MMHHFRLALPAIAVAVTCGCASAPPPVTTQSPMERVRAELLEVANRQPARPVTRPEALDRALLPPMQIDAARPAAKAEPRFDLAVSNAPASQVFLSIANGSRYSMLVAPEVTGNLTVNLKDVTVREALDALRELFGYEYRMQGTRIYIQPNTLQTRVFQVNYLAAKRQGTTEMRVTSGSISGASGGSGGGGANGGSPTSGGGGSTHPSSRVATENNTDFWGELRSALDTIVGTEGNRKVIVNPLSGVVAVRGFPADIRNAEKYLRMTQLIIERQVMIEAKIIEVHLSDSYSSGINWAAFKGGRISVGQGAPGTLLAPTGLIGTGGGVDATTGTLTDPLLAAVAGMNLITNAANTGSIFGLAFQSSNFAALLQFLETQGNVQVLSSPRIATINNQKAVLKVGTDDFFVTSVSTSTTSSASGGNVTSPTISVQPFFSGIALDVTPQIDENDAIILHLHPSVSTVEEKQKNLNLGSLGRFQLPLASSTVNESDSVVRVQDGHIVAIGGLMKQQQSSNASGLPGTVGTPLGGVLGQRSRANMKSELVMLLKPTIIRGESGWQSDVGDVNERLRGFESPKPAQEARAARPR